MSMRTWPRRVLVAGSVACALGCAATRPASRPRPTIVVVAPAARSAAGDPPPARAHAGAACDTAALPPPDVIAGNVATTDVTGVGRVVSVKIEPTPLGAIVRVVYELDGIVTFAGADVVHVRLIQDAEAGFTPRPAGQWLFFSACQRPDGNLHEPDVGYVFPVDAACQEDTALAKRAFRASIDSAQRGSACRDP